MSRKQRADSVTAAITSAQAGQIVPPSNVPLVGEDMPFFASVIGEFARTEWTAHQLELAALLAKKMRLLRDELATLETEGFVGVTANGSPCQNPRLGGVRMLDTSIMATRRSLQIHARAQGGEARDTGKRRGHLRDAEDSFSDDDLLARPN